VLMSCGVVLDGRMALSSLFEPLNTRQQSYE